jgi:hypothetical protein
MRRPHVAYIGRDDAGTQHALPAIRQRLQTTHAPLEIVELPGDHFTSKPAAIAAFVRWLQTR